MTVEVKDWSGRVYLNRFKSDDGDPFVVIGREGVARGWNGKHRGTAAMRQGRTLRARVWDEREQT